MSFKDLRAKRAARQLQQKLNEPEAYVQPTADSVGGLDTKRMDIYDSSPPTDKQAKSIVLQSADHSTSGARRDNKQAELEPPKDIVYPAQAPLPSDRHEASEPTSTQPPASTSRSVSASSSIDLERNGLYKDVPSFLSLKKSSTSGRGLYAKETIKAGTTIVVARPHVHALSSTHLSNYCSYCCEQSRQGKDLRRCPDCKILHYCGSACQSSDWKVHKSECEALRRLSSTESNSDNAHPIPGEAVRTVARIIWQRKKEGGDSIWWREIGEMYSDRTSHPSAVLASTANDQFRFALDITRYLGVAGPQELAALGVADVGQLVDLTSKFSLNAFTLTAPDLSPIGVCISPSAALINHSCDPNVVMVFPRSSSTISQSEPALKVIALRDIPAESELLTSYIDTTLPTVQRQQTLKETYGFTCVCSLCSPKHAGDGRSRGSIGNAQSNVRPPDWRISVFCPRKTDGCTGRCLIPESEDDKAYCHQCGTQLHDSEHVVEASRLGQEALTKASKLEFSDPAKALKLTTNMLSYLTMAGLTPSTHPLLGISRLHQTLLTYRLDFELKEDLDNAIRVAAKNAAGLSNILRVGHPVRAMAFTELGKFLAVDEPLSSSTSTSGFASPSNMNSKNDFPPSGEARLRLALETLQRAHSELLIAFGGVGSEIGRQVRQMLVGIERELAVWRNGLRDELRDRARDPRFR